MFWWKNVTSKVKNTLLEFAEHFRESDDSENSNVYYGRFLWNGLRKGIGSKSIWDVQYLEVC